MKEGRGFSEFSLGRAAAGRDLKLHVHRRPAPTVRVDIYTTNGFRMEPLKVEYECGS